MISEPEVFICQVYLYLSVLFATACPCYAATFLLQLHQPVCHDVIFFLDFVLHHLQFQLPLAVLPVANSPFISSSNSLLTSEKLFTKFNGFCISCAMPAVSSPSEAIFSDCINCVAPVSDRSVFFPPVSWRLPVY